MYFNMKNYLKNIHNHTTKHILKKLLKNINKQTFFIFYTIFHGRYCQSFPWRFFPASSRGAVNVHTCKGRCGKGQEKISMDSSMEEGTSIRVYIILSSLKYSCSFFFLILFKVTFFLLHMKYFIFLKRSCTLFS
jgi:hypothetical protein